MERWAVLLGPLITGRFPSLSEEVMWSYQMDFKRLCLSHRLFTQTGAATVCVLYECLIHTRRSTLGRLFSPCLLIQHFVVLAADDLRGKLLSWIFFHFYHSRASFSVSIHGVSVQRDKIKHCDWFGFGVFSSKFRLEVSTCEFLNGEHSSIPASWGSFKSDVMQL